MAAGRLSGHTFGGIVFAYMGPIEESRHFPRYDRFELPGVRLEPGPRLPFQCNWVQVKENAMDPAHTAILHAWEGVFAAEFGNFRSPGARRRSDGVCGGPQKRRQCVGAFDRYPDGEHSQHYVDLRGRTYLERCSPPFIDDLDRSRGSTKLRIGSVLFHIMDDDHLPAAAPASLDDGRPHAEPALSATPRRFPATTTP